MTIKNYTNRFKKFEKLIYGVDIARNYALVVPIVFFGILMIVTLFRTNNIYQTVGADSGTATGLFATDDKAPGTAENNWAATGGTETNSGTCVDDTDGCNFLDDNDTASTTYLGTGTGMNGTTAEEEFEIEDFSVSGIFDQITSVTVYIDAVRNGACNGGGSNCDDLNVRIFVGGAYNATTKTIAGSTATPADGLLTTTSTESALVWSGLTETVSATDLRVEITRVVNGSGSPSSKDDDVQISEVRVDVDYDYTPPTTYSQITQQDYIFENDDATTATALAGSSFSSPTTLTDARVGERVNLRMQIKNTGNAALSSTDELALFYDRNDGIWSKVESKTAAATPGSCTNTAWDCETILAASSGLDSSVAFDPYGNTWIAHRDSGINSLRVSNYVGSGGNCDDPAWDCTIIDHSTTNIGWYSSIGFDPSGTAWISYKDLNGASAARLKVATYVGSGGNCDDVDGSDAWNCTVVDNGGTDAGGYSRLVFDHSGAPWIAYQFFDAGSNREVKVATYVGSGGNCDDDIGSDAWDCTVVDGRTDSVGREVSIAFDHSGSPWISYENQTTGSLMVANYVDSGGNCDDDGGSDAWDCTVVDNSEAQTGQSSRIAVDSSGAAWVAYTSQTSSSLMVATYVGSGGNCDDVDGSDAWNCTEINNDGASSSKSITVGPNGGIWVGYRNAAASDGTERIATYVGSGGNCDDVDGSDAWNCVGVTDGLINSLDFDPSGTAWMTFRSGTSLAVAKLQQPGEILIASSQPLESANSLTTSHVDMTSASDTTNRDDADCISGSTTWNNGVYLESENGTGVSLPVGNVTAQCTEVMWTLDTSQAVPGTTYRFAVATKDKDATYFNEGLWRGPISITDYPTITINSDYTNRFAKDAFYEMANCTDADWGCDTILSDNSAGLYSNIAVDPSGTPWVAFSESASDDLWVAKYVGSGGSCDAVAGSDAWECTLVDASDTQFIYASIAFELDGTAWISYYGAGADVELAKYVGSGGTGCTSSAWTCVELDTGNLEGGYSSLVIGSDGVPWLSFYSGAGATCDDSPTDECSLKIARYVGSDGTGCDATTEWTCEIIENPTTTGAIGEYTSIALDANGLPWISYYDKTNTNLKLARYVGAGGSGCISLAWTCITVDSSDTGEDGYGGTSLAFDSAGNAWISYQARPSSSIYGLKVVTNKASPGFGAACTASGWVCGYVDDRTRAFGLYSSIAFDADGVDPWISVWVGDSGGDGCNNSPTNECSLAVIKFVGSGGSSPCSSEWRCEIVDNPTSTGNVGQYTSIAFDNSGSPWVSYYDVGNTALKIAKTHMSQSPLSASISNTFSHRNAGSGDARYPLTSGSGTIDTKPDCTTVDDYEGYCGVRENDGNYDSLVADVSERVLFTGAFYSYQNTELSGFTWRGNTTLAPSTASSAGDLGLEVYRFGTTNAWESLDTDTASSDCSTVQCSLNGLPSGTATEYFESDGGSSYWIYARVYQKAGTASYTFKTDSFQRSQTLSLMRHGAVFEDRVLSPFRY